MLTRETLLQTVGDLPAHCTTRLQQVYYVASKLRTSPDAEIAAAAKSLYDGSISRLAQHKATSTPAAVADEVLARAAHAMMAGLEAAPTFGDDDVWMAPVLPSVEEMVAQLDAAQNERIDRLDGTLPPLEDEPDETAQFIAWCATMTAEREAEQRRKAARQSRLRRKALIERLRLVDLEDYEDSDEAAEWSGWQGVA